MKVKMLRPLGVHAAGDLVEFADDQAKELIEAKYAEAFSDAGGGKAWVKMTAAYAGQAAGAVVQVDEAIAKAWCGRKVAEPADDPTKSELAKSLEEFTKQVKQKAVDAAREAATETAKSLDVAAKTLHKVVASPKGDDPQMTGGFKSLGHFCWAVRKGAGSHAEPAAVKSLSDYSEIIRKAPSGMYEGSDPDGGLLVPPQMATEIWDKVRAAPDSLVGRTTSYSVRGNSMSFRGLSESSRATGSRFGGVRAYWEGEADQLAGSRPKFDDRFLRLKKLAALVYVTQEQLDDSEIALEQYLGRLVSQEINFVVTDALVRGTGAGQPVGILGSNVPVSVAKESGQAAATVTLPNVAKMWARMYAPSRANAIWMVNQDVEQQLYQLALSVGTGGSPVFLPAGGASVAPFSTLFGRPIIPFEQCETLGTVGDIILADWSQYLMITKGAGPQTASSMHLRFDYDEQVFRWTFRLDGQPAWKAALTPYKGSATQSPFVTLATRA